MSIYGIGTAGYPMTGYESRKTPRSAAANNYTNQMSSVTQTTQMSSGTFELHISNDTDGEAVGATCGSDYSVTVYQPNDFDPVQGKGVGQGGKCDRAHGGCVKGRYQKQ